MVNALEPGQININGWFQRVADRVGHQETYGVPGGAMSFFQNIFRGGGQAVTGPEDTAPQSESSTGNVDIGYQANRLSSQMKTAKNG